MRSEEKAHGSKQGPIHKHRYDGMYFRIGLIGKYIVKYSLNLTLRNSHFVCIQSYT